MAVFQRFFSPHPLRWFGMDSSKNTRHSLVFVTWKRSIHRRPTVSREGYAYNDWRHVPPRPFNGWAEKPYCHLVANIRQGKILSTVPFRSHFSGTWWWLIIIYRMLDRFPWFYDWKRLDVNGSVFFFWNLLILPPNPVCSPDNFSREKAHSFWTYKKLDPLFSSWYWCRLTVLRRIDVRDELSLV